CALKEYIVNLKTTTLVKERIESELKVAHDIQMGIIPKTFPPYPDRPEFDIYAVLEPAKEVGGDLYDFFLIDDSRFCFAIGDVAGKGVPASLFMAITRTLLHAKFSRSLKLSRIVESINEDLSTNNENMMFVTFFVGILDTATGAIEYCNAGHNPPYIVRSNGDVEEMPKTKDTPLGIMPRAFSVGNMSLNLGDSIFLYTDGVTEAISSENKFYGEDRLKAILKNLAGKKSKDIVCEVLADIKTFAKGAEQSDDITELQIKFISKTVKKASENKEAKKMIIKNKLPELAKVAELIEEIGEKWGVSQKAVIDVNVCVEELIVNTISYGYSEGAEREIEISVTREERAIKIRIEDDGLEFDPLKAPAPVDMDKPLMDRKIGGLGIHFVKNLMDDFEYKRADGKNIITLTKNI
ncbi:MAG TPA: SpoIIE family protein phosphatase, partial [Candidatus Wallbacteria bacterium]|nr:SpoIIE family protein phosphatase [Candidatus Wallbacteria bacterium]